MIENIQNWKIKLKSKAKLRLWDSKRFGAAIRDGKGWYITVEEARIMRDKNNARQEINGYGGK